MKKKICVVTGSRADYGILKTLMSLLKDSSTVVLQLAVTAAHLSKEFGYTVQNIEKDGFIVDERVECIQSSDSYAAMSKSIGLAVIGFTESLSRLKPDCVVVLGDRFEIFAAAQAAYCLKIPIAHLHGGELTEGAQDDGFRHAVTKLSHLHFVSHEDYRKRVIQLGESPKSVHVCGAPGLDLIHSASILTKEKLSNYLSFSLKEYFLVTLHPSAFDTVNASETATILIEALEEFGDKQLLITAANADPQGRIINKIFRDYSLQYPERVKLVDNLSEYYFSAIKHCVAVVGNSSSAILEVPYFNKPTVNLGTRQQGRKFANTIIQADIVKSSIIRGLNLALDNDWIKANLIKPEQLFGTPGEVSKKIYEHLCAANLKDLLKKRFYET